MKKLRVGVVGTGFWGKNHIRVFNELEKTELVAICDVNADRVNQVAIEFDVKPYTNTQNMLKREKLDAVSICTWSTKLAKEAFTALKMGKHVLIEKPMATNQKQAKKMVQIAEREELILEVGFLMRFIPGIKRIKKAIKTKKIGNLVCASAKRVSKWPERIGDVGVVKDLSIHDIDMVRYLSEDEPVAVYAKTGKMKHKQFEDYAQIMLTFKDGKTAFIESNWLTPYKTRTLVITGSEAIMKLDYITQELTIETVNQTIVPRDDWEEPLKLELNHFANCILNKETPLITGRDGLKAIQFAEAALKSSLTNRCIMLKE